MKEKEKPEDKKVTDSWKAYKHCLDAIQRYLSEVRIESGEAWVGDVCFGSPSHPLVTAPLRRDSAAIVGRSVERIEMVSANVIESVRKAVETSQRVLQELQAEGEVETADVQRVVDRIKSLEQLREELESAARGCDVACHPVQLLRWSEILTGSFVPGNPAVPVRVVTTYVL